MNNKSIILNATEVNSLIKTGRVVVRRVMDEPQIESFDTRLKHYHPTMIDEEGEEYPGKETYGIAEEDWSEECPWGELGSLFWVKEAWANFTSDNGDACVVFKSDMQARAVLCEESGEGDEVGLAGVRSLHGWDKKTLDDIRFRPSINMRQWASRRTIKLTAVCVGQIQKTTEEEAIAEGYACDSSDFTALDNLEFNWDDDNGHLSWDENPFVWRGEFERCEA